VPGTTTKKWCGIIWDSPLSFTPFLRASIAAARTAFQPLIALAREGAAPVEELREVMRAKVEGTLFFAAMFTALAEGAIGELDQLQVELEGTLAGAPPWSSAALVGAVAGW